ncbi:hypothetical protein BZG36_03713 [Bifiguratus adelaidae]|uniref:Uncharacterized protein n=1 Tax=Bifiguratus adelaidae TaxID=1938954 RepID=A0A261XXG6_9FUNG|nr:hypothetical protein BZG36_03713 [Bifiguratus adelaidae]
MKTNVLIPVACLIAAAGVVKAQDPVTTTVVVEVTKVVTVWNTDVVATPVPTMDAPAPSMDVPAPSMDTPAPCLLPVLPLPLVPLTLVTLW